MTLLPVRFPCLMDRLSLQHCAQQLQTHQLALMMVRKKRNFWREKCIDFETGADVFYRYQSSVTGFVSIDTCSSTTDFDTTLTALIGGSVLACNDDACGFRSKIVLPVRVGDVVLVRVAGFRRATGVGVLLVNSFSNSTCPSWPGPSVCPLLYNTSCFSLNFFFDDLVNGFAVQGCSCPPRTTVGPCLKPPTVPLPPCQTGGTPPTDCLRFNLHFGRLLAAADPKY
jgi:hypothetical protein